MCASTNFNFVLFFSQRERRKPQKKGGYQLLVLSMLKWVELYIKPQKKRHIYIVVLPKRVLVSETLILESINKLYSPKFLQREFLRATQICFSPGIFRKTNIFQRVQNSFLICENQKCQHTSIRFEEGLFVWIPQRMNPVGGVQNQIQESEKLEVRCHRCEPPLVLPTI